MKYISTCYLQDGMVIAETVMGRQREKLLTAGCVLDADLIDILKKHSVPGVYIGDEEAKNNISEVDVIKAKFKAETINGINKVFLNSQNSKMLVCNIKNQASNLLEEIAENKSVVDGLISLKYFDNYVYEHSIQVAVISIIIGITIGMERENLLRLGASALLHDIGKIFIDTKIIDKPDVLTDEEFKIVATHSELGYKYARENCSESVISYDGVLDHHERFDGTGYPNGKAGTNISIFGRIISVADVYSAITSERPQRHAMCPSEAMEYIMGNCDTMFDPYIVQKFLNKIAPYPVGSTVQLSNGCTAIVLENYESFGMRPRLKVIKDRNEVIEPYEINLSSDYSLLNIVITGIVQ